MQDDGHAAVPELQAHTLDPQQFWASFVAARKPALIHGHPTDMGWRASGLWTDEYLTKQAGDAEVLVEVRQGPGEAYGRGIKRRMRFAAFVKQLSAGNSNLYLTAQQVPVAPDGHPELLTAPLDRLAGDFPSVPQLAGSLVPQSINMWMGAAPEGSSSGLHHDFHDNLYVLLRGRKRFRLWPPAAVERMYTVGQLAVLHPNGRIVYRGQGEVLPDGTDAKDAAAWRARSGAEAAVTEAEAAVKRGDAGAAEKLAAAEAQLEEVLEAELEGALDGEDGFGDDSEGDDVSGDDSDGDDVMGGLRDDYVGSDDDDQPDSDDEDGAGRGRGAKGGRAGKGAANGKGGAAGGAQGSKGKGGAAGRGEGGGGEADGGLIVEADAPPSFSRVDLGLSDAQLAARFPRFPGRASALEVEVAAGDMLYLPAGWFHEVTSTGSGGPGGGHLAVNYWFHPPDRLDPSRRGFVQPYTSDYWPSLWRRRLASGRYGSAPDGGGAGSGDAGGGQADHHHEWHREAHPGRSALHHGSGSGGSNGGGGGGGGAGGQQEQQQQPHHAAGAHVGFRGADVAQHDASQHAHLRSPPPSTPMTHGSAGQGAGAGGGASGADLSPPRRPRALAAAQPGQGGKDGEGPGSDGGGGGGGASRRARMTTALKAMIKAREQAAAAEAAAGGRDPASRTYRLIRQLEAVPLGMGDAGGELRPADAAAAAAARAAKEALGLGEDEYELLLLHDAMRQRNAAQEAMQALVMRRVALESFVRLRARLPPGRRHHPVVAVPPAVRKYRPTSLAAAGGVGAGKGVAGGGAGGGGKEAVKAGGKGGKAAAAAGAAALAAPASPAAGDGPGGSLPPSPSRPAIKGPHSPVGGKGCSVAWPEGQLTAGPGARPVLAGRVAAGRVAAAGPGAGGAQQGGGKRPRR